MGIYIKQWAVSQLVTKKTPHGETTNITTILTDDLMNKIECERVVSNMNKANNDPNIVYTVYNTQTV